MRMQRKGTGFIETGRLILAPRSVAEMALLCESESDGEMKRRTGRCWKPCDNIPDGKRG